MGNRRAMNYPCIHLKNGSLKIEFAPELDQATRKPLRMVLDFGSFGGVLGIEILDLTHEAGKQALGIISQVVATAGEGTRYAYDDASDSFYLQVQSGNSLDQESVDGSVTCDEEGRIIALSAEWAHSS